jgi:hypothetical protein
MMMMMIMMMIMMMMMIIIIMIIIINKIERICTPIDVTIPADRNVVQKEAEKNVKIQDYRYRDTANVELKCIIIPVIIGATGVVTKSLRYNSGSYTGKTFERFTATDSYTWNIAHNTESTAAEGVTGGSREVPGRKGP